MFFSDALNQDNFVIVNIWTSAENKAIPGANVGHVSLQTKNNYISLWPGARIDKNKDLNKFEKLYLRYFQERSPSFKSNYEEDCAFEALSEDRSRDIKHINECKPGEIPYIINYSTARATIATDQPHGLEKDSYLVAISPVLANVRIVLYGLRLDAIENEFLERVNKVTGWRLIGSNIISRNLDEQSAENCSSLAYRLLKAGGLYVKLENHSSSDNSSVVSPDDLVKHLIAYKEKELMKFPNSKEWFGKNPYCREESSVEELKYKLENKRPKGFFGKP